MNNYKVILKLEIPVAAKTAQEALDIAFFQVQTPGLLYSSYTLLDAGVYPDNPKHTPPPTPTNTPIPHQNQLRGKQIDNVGKSTMKKNKRPTRAKYDEFDILSYPKTKIAKLHDLLERIDKD